MKRGEREEIEKRDGERGKERVGEGVEYPCQYMICPPNTEHYFQNAIDTLNHAKR